MNTELLIENIRRICHANGIPPTNACIESGVGRSFISDMKRGKTPSVAKVQMLAEYLGVTTSELLGEKKPAAPDEDSRKKSNTIRIAGRDGSFEERELSDEQMQILKGLLKQMPEVTDL